MRKEAITHLKTTIESLHNCKATYLHDLLVKETFERKVVWEGMVSVFKVDHAKADTCFAWSSPIGGSDKRKFYAVLKIPPVDSPKDAIKASIVSDYKGGKT